MFNFLKNNVHESFLIIILVLGSWLRFHHYGEMSLANDELSALYRLNFDTFGDLIDKGVKPDGHPAFVQVFLYYWIKLSGISEYALRFPFVIAGIVSIWLVYLIGCRWFNKTTGVFAALSISFLQFTVYYSQLARPYSLGLLFSLLTVYFWTEILFTNNSKNKI
ncbi:MAG: glycosyltransferase family 39 protein [Bacteroidetes bacterium]|nr:glycosyltransferase family 39 protein [Bacteroidota bacterium]